MRTTILLPLVAAFGAALVHASNVLDLTKTADYEAKVGKDVGALVEYFAPWCGHCKNLVPEYEKLADAFSSKKDKVHIAKVDADQNRELGQRVGLQSFPTIKWHPANSMDTIEYNGERTAEALADFVSKHSRVRSHLNSQEPPSTVELTAETFDDVANDPKKNVLVMFYAPWCGHCKNLAPVWEQAAKVFKRDENCVFAKIDMTEPENEAIKRRFQISSYPTILFLQEGSNDKFPRQFLRERTFEDLVAHMNEKCSTFRSADGSLTQFAGRLPALDGLASRFYSAADSARAMIYGEAKKYAAELSKESSSAKDSAAAYYLRVMERATRDGAGYISQESNRIAKILAKHASGAAQFSDEKLDQLQRKANVLGAFTNAKIASMAERASSSIAQAEATAHSEL
ncbi:protein disulfide-isomerase [Malassezia sp. CBS 17886]|nr:protein disulfide-isomerase [Malassezia sp. CBS 17886]